MWTREHTRGVWAGLQGSHGLWLLVLAALVLATVPALAQLTTATIRGTVTDQGGAILPGVTVTITNVETGTVRTVVTDESGRYVGARLPVGTYDVTTALEGFAKSVRDGITLAVGRTAVVDHVLGIRTLEEEVVVSGDAPLVETTSATQGGLVDPEQMRELPLNARSFIELVPLQTGATFTEAGNVSSPTWGFGRELSVVGTRYDANSFLLDGADVNNVGNVAGSAAGTMAGVETVREFRVVTNAYDAEYGRHAGAVVSAITKSGTNRLDGSLFWFHRNDDLDAANFFDNKFGATQPEFRRNQFGVSAGGPIARDRTFFFGSYEGLREELGQTSAFNVPGVAMRAGRLPSGPVGVDPIIQRYLDAYPAPNVPQPNGSFDRPDGTAQFSKATNQVTDEDLVTVRIDHRFSDSDNLFGRFSRDDANKTTPDLTTEEVLSNANRFFTV